MVSDYAARWLITDIGTLDRSAWRTDVPAMKGLAYTLNLWFYPVRLDGKQVIAWLTRTDSTGWKLAIVDGVCWFSTLHGDTPLAHVTTPVKAAGRWHHAVVVVDGEARQIRFYLDGVVRSEAHLPDRSSAQPGGELAIGGHTDPAGGHYDHTFGRNQTGLVDDVRLYARALTGAEVAGTYPVQGKKPGVHFEVTAAGWTAPVPVTLEAILSQGEQSGVRAYLWDFGDGETALGTCVDHTYEYGGRYRVRLTLITSDHQQAYAEQEIELVGDRPLQAYPVFENGTEGYACYRIPSIVSTPKGTLLAFAEARMASCSDSTDIIRVVCKRSFDNGRTWEDLQVVARNLVGDREYVVQNTSPVVDTVYGSGRIVLVYNKSEYSEWELTRGVGISRTYCIFSDDDGASWHDEQDITMQVHRPYNPDYVGRYADAARAENAPMDWRIQRPTLGHALQLRSGRIVHAGVFTSGERSVFESQNYLFWSDDLGDTWQTDSAIPYVGLNEATAVELDSGSVMVNSRAYRDQKSVGWRAVTVGHFRGNDDVVYEETRFDQALIDPAVQASLLRLTFSDQIVYGAKSRLLFANPNHPKGRYNLTVRLSYDEGQTWPEARTIDTGPAAYSDLVVQDDKRIGVLYERGNQGGIVYASFSLTWLTYGRDSIGD